MTCVDKLRRPLSATAIDMIDISIPQLTSIQSSKNHITQKRDSIMNTSRVSVSHRIERRRDLHNRLCLTSNIMCFLGLFGIVLMITENEINFAVGDDGDNIVNWLIKLIISISTIILIGLILYYHLLDLHLYCVKNSTKDWRIGLTSKKIFLITIEILICSIHPFPQQFYSNWSSVSTSTASVPMSYTSVDVALGIPMFARLYLVCRFMMYHSHLVRNASSQSLSSLNQVSMDFFFLMKTYLEQWPTRCLGIFCIMIFLIGSWSLRACDYRPTPEHMPILDSMWLLIVTFTTVGYGDITPTTYCGRGVATIIALVGVLSTALLISVVAQKLILTRWEKYVHNFVLNIELAKERKNQAANVIKFAIKVWYLTRKDKSKSFQCLKVQRKLFRSINVIQEVKLEQRKLVTDNCVVLADLFTLQRNENDKTETIIQEIDTMKIAIDKIEEKFTDLNQTMNNMQHMLNVLLDRIMVQQRRNDLNMLEKEKLNSDKKIE